MDLTIMRHRQGVVKVNDITKQPLLQDVDTPLYFNYRCSAQQEAASEHVITTCSLNKACRLWCAIECGETLRGADIG